MDVKCQKCSVTNKILTKVKKIQVEVSGKLKHLSAACSIEKRNKNKKEIVTRGEKESERGL